MATAFVLTPITTKLQYHRFINVSIMHSMAQTTHKCSIMNTKMIYPIQHILSKKPNWICYRGPCLGYIPMWHICPSYVTSKKAKENINNKYTMYLVTPFPLTYQSHPPPPEEMIKTISWIKKNAISTMTLWTHHFKHNFFIQTISKSRIYLILSILIALGAWLRIEICNLEHMYLGVIMQLHTLQKEACIH